MTANGFDERLTMAAQRLVTLNCPLRLAWPAARMPTGSAPDRPLQPGAGRTTLLRLGFLPPITFQTSRFMQRIRMPPWAGCPCWQPQYSIASNRITT